MLNCESSTSTPDGGGGTSADRAADDELESRSPNKSKAVGRVLDEWFVLKTSIEAAASAGVRRGGDSANSGAIMLCRELLAVSVRSETSPIAFADEPALVDGRLAAMPNVTGDSDRPSSRSSDAGEVDRLGDGGA
jgi:hypothetical protein